MTHSQVTCPRRFRGDSLILILPTAVLFTHPFHEPRWLFMWLLAIAIFVGLKWLTWRRTETRGVRWWINAGYLFLWPGLDAKTFLTESTHRKVPSPDLREWVSSVGFLLTGLLFIFVGPRLVPHNGDYWIAWMGMVGVVFVLHFGSFHFLSCLWRSIGIEARPLMNHPLRSQSLSEFWGKRWNTAFRDLTHRFLFLPLTFHLGPRWGMAAGFFVSGLIHDVVISIPAGGGYGLPTLFFVLQAAGFFIERSKWGRERGLKRRPRGRMFTLAFLVIPLPILFHFPFIRGVFVPFMEAIGAVQHL